VKKDARAPRGILRGFLTLVARVWESWLFIAIVVTSTLSYDTAVSPAVFTLKWFPFGPVLVIFSYATLLFSRFGPASEHEAAHGKHVPEDVLTPSHGRSDGRIVELDMSFEKKTPFCG